MAKGRFISKEICLDKRVSELSDGYSMVGFTWLITHADCEGRIYGDPAIVKSLIFPRRMDVTVEMVAGYIQEWEAAGLIKTYEVNGDIYIQFPNFDKHQVGLRKDREPVSHIPAKCGNHPEEISENRVNVKLIEVNSNVNDNCKNHANFYLEFQEKIGIPLMGGKDIDYVDELLKENAPEKLLEITTWLKARDPAINSMWKALRAIDTAARNWSNSKNNGKVNIEAVLKEMMEESDGK